MKIKGFVFLKGIYFMIIIMAEFHHCRIVDLIMPFLVICSIMKYKSYNKTSFMPRLWKPNVILGSSCHAGLFLLWGWESWWVSLCWKAEVSCSLIKVEVFHLPCVWCESLLGCVSGMRRLWPGVAVVQDRAEAETPEQAQLCTLQCTLITYSTYFNTPGSRPTRYAQNHLHLSLLVINNMHL